MDDEPCDTAQARRIGNPAAATQRRDGRTMRGNKLTADVRAI